MRKILIADAHLRMPDDPNYRKLLEFLSGLAGNTDTLFILGDLFEFWIGYRNTPFTHYLPVLEKLRQLAESGVSIVFFEGNHDFHMGPIFTETLKARVYRGPAILDIEGKRVALCHGDQINDSDPGYRLLRFLMHNRLSGMMIPIIPPRFISWVADQMGRSSKKRHKVRNRKWDFRGILQSYAERRFADGCDIVISAHFHTPFLERNGDRILLSLGDWITQFSYGEWHNGDLKLKTYPESGGGDLEPAITP